MEEKIADVELNDKKENNIIDDKTNNVNIESNNEANDISESTNEIEQTNALTQ